MAILMVSFGLMYVSVATVAKDVPVAGHVTSASDSPAEAASSSQPASIDAESSHPSSSLQSGVGSSGGLPGSAADAKDLTGDSRVARKLAAMHVQRQIQQGKLLARIAAAQEPFTFRVGTFNILATQHTESGGQHAGWPSWTWRIAREVELMKDHGIDVIGLQEVKPVQLDYLTNGLGFDAFPGYERGARETDNSILYDPKVWRRVTASTFQFQFMHAVRHQPILKLQHIASGQQVYFVNMHASAGHDAKNTRTRAQGHNAAISIINELKKDDLPVILTGDMNDRGTFFCRVLPPTGMHSANGGSTSTGCRPPGQMAVDWIVGTPDVTFSGYRRDGTPQARKISDHFIISASVTASGPS